MRLIKAVSIFCTFSTLVLFGAACGVSSLGGSEGGNGGAGASGGGGMGSGNGGSGSTGGAVCSSPNPAGCKVTGCSAGETCVEQG